MGRWVSSAYYPFSSSDKIRAEEKAVFDKNSAEMKKGVEGVKLALKVLREYYAKDDKSHGSADGAGSGIIGLLEVCDETEKSTPLPIGRCDKVNRYKSKGTGFRSVFSEIKLCFYCIVSKRHN